MLDKQIFLIRKLIDYQKRSDVEKSRLLKFKNFYHRWSNIEKKYRYVSVYGIEFVSIGETICRLMMYLKDSNRTVDVYHVVLPTFYENYTKGVFNSDVFDVFSEKINFITEDDINFWMYAVLFHSNKIQIDKFNLLKYRHGNQYLMNLGIPAINLPSQIIERGKRELELMNITRKYICIYARERGTKDKNFRNYGGTSCASVSLETFQDTIDFLKEMNYQIVRMGKDEDRACNFDGVVDYANKFWKGYMDFFLLSNCELMIGSPGGLSVVSPFFGRPILLTNLNVLDCGLEAFPMTSFDLYIPKKFYSKRKKRLLNLYEVLNISNRCHRSDEKLEEEMIDIIDNTANEILNATKEIMDKMTGNWKYSRDEEILREKYSKIMRNWKKRHKNINHRRIIGCEDYTMIQIPIAYTYLKENLYFLDVDDNYLLDD